MRRGFLKGIACGLTAAALAMSAAAATADDRTIEYRYEVEAGDTVYDIAARVATPHDDINRLSWEICRDNGIRGGVIQPGQMLTIRLHPAY